MRAAVLHHGPAQLQGIQQVPDSHSGRTFISNTQERSKHSHELTARMERIHDNFRTLYLILKRRCARTKIPVCIINSTHSQKPPLGEHIACFS